MARDTSTNIARYEEKQAQLNAEQWARGEFVDLYATTSLRPVEAVLIERFRDELAGRVLELGCGAGRLTGHLAEVAREVHGIDLSPAMVAHCQQAYPHASFSVRDLRDLSGFEDGAYDVVAAPFNVLDVLGDAERRQVLGDIRRVLAVDGLLIMSSHNRGYALRLPATMRLWMRLWVGSPRRPITSIRNLRRRFGNRRRLRPLEHVEDGYAVLNDEAHEFSVLHYYISRDAQERQLTELGYEFLECRDLDGRSAGRGETAPQCPELHYVARR